MSPGGPSRKLPANVFASPVRSGIGAVLPRCDAGVLRLGRCLRHLGLAEHHAVAGGAGDAVARQRRIVRKLAHLVVGLERDGIQHLALERLARTLLGMLVDDELALTLYGVAAETGVLHGARRFRMEGLGLARELREEDRIASRQVPWARCATCRRARG